MKHKKSVLAVAVILGATLTGGIASAKTIAPKSAKACTTSNGTLSLLVKGKCAKGSKAITLSATGPTGPKGATGLQGVRGNQGPAGPFETQLSAGQTLTGAYAAEADGTFVGTTISFPFPAATAPNEVFVPKTGTNPDSVHCTGTPSAPTAAAGYLCVYEGNRVNVGSVFFGDVTNGSRSGFTRFGGDLEFSNSGSSLLVDEGTWALTGS